MDIPDEILEYIFSFLKTRDLIKMLQLSKEKNNSILAQDSFLWKHLIIQEWKTYLPSSICKGSMETCVFLQKCLSRVKKVPKEDSDNVISIHLKGASKTGKSTLKDLWNKGIINEKYDPTIAFALYFSSLMIEDKIYKVKLFDHAGVEDLQPKRSPFSSSLYSGKSAVLYLVDITSETFDTIDSHMSDIRDCIKKSLGEKVEVPVETLVGTSKNPLNSKFDFTEKSKKMIQTNYQKGKEFASKKDIPFVQVTLDPNSNYQLPFYLCGYLLK